MTRRRSGNPRLAIAAALAIIATATGSAAAADPATAPPGGTRLIVRYRAETAAERRSGEVHLEVVTTKPGESVIAATARLQKDPDVVRVSLDHQRFRRGDPERPRDPRDEDEWVEQWGMHNTGQRLFGGEPGSQGKSNVDIDGLQALGVTRGDAKVVVAVIDDGVDFSHPDLVDRAWSNPGESGGGRETNGIDDDDNGYIDDVHGWDFCHDDATVHDPDDDFHGTHVAGTIAASLNGRGVVGVAPGISIMALKFLGDDDDCGYDSQAIAAIAYARSFGIRIANASWGGRGDQRSAPELYDAIKTSGMLFVASAGNDSIDNDTDPLPELPATFDLSNIISVAAIDNAGGLPDFTNTGRRTVDLAAPGVSILSSVPAETGDPDSPWTWLDGTSMSAAFVSGTAALVASRSPALLSNPSALKARILGSAKAMRFTKGATRTGGIVDAYRALDSTGPVTRTPTRVGFRKDSILGAKSVRAWVSWPAATDDLSGVRSYGVGLRIDKGGWSTYTASTTARSAERSVAFGRSYRFRVRARDAAGNWGAFSNGPAMRVSLLQQSARSIAYHGTWGTWRSRRASGGTTKFTKTSGATARFSFTGRAFAIVAPRGATSGKVKLYVDGRYHSTVDLHRAKAQSRVLVVRQSWSSSSKHTVKLVAVVSAKRPRVDLDAIVVMR